jgi:hypothetical protein
MSETLAGSRVATVILPRSAAEAEHNGEDAYRLTEAIISYVNDMQQVGVYAAHELPAKAMQAYHADYYLAQVNNGGHSQFIHNCGEQWPTVVADALAGLEAMGALEQHRILMEAAAWVHAHPEAAGEQDGFSTRAEPLDEFDERFYAAEGETPMTALAASWIAGWPEVRVVADDAYARAIDELAAINPHLGPRRIWQTTAALRHQMNDSLQISIAVACGAVAPEPEAKVAPVRGGAYYEIDGRQQLAFSVETDKGWRLCVADEAGARLYDFKWNPDRKLEDILKEGSPRPGARLAAVGADTIERFAAVAHATQAAEAIDLLLRTAKLDPAATLTASRLQDDGATWIAVIGQRRVVATVSRHGADLTEPNGMPLLSVTKAEIDRHATVAAQGLATMCPPD